MSFITIKIPQGQLKGKKNLDLYENEYYSFEGIPYAKPPIGNLRFKPPQPADSWEGEFDATIGTKICPSYINTQLHPDLVDEDCLRVNVYTPVDLTKEPLSKLPVMVYIHGGGLIFGSGHRNDLGPDFLMTKNVILVTFNYRLGVLGFFSLNNIEINVTGNAGLKDIIELLKWVQMNISNFGGNPNNVTIFGNSAGGILAHYIQVSRLSKGLFNKIILQSGSVLLPGALNRSTVLYNNYLKALGCTIQEPKLILEFLQNMNHEKLCLAEGDYFKNFKSLEHSSTSFVPSIEIDHPSAMFTIDPEILLQNGYFHACPTMIGYTEMDGSILPKLRKAQPDNTDMSIYIPKKVLNAYNPEMIPKLLKLYQLYYYGNETPSYLNKDIFYMLTTDLVFLRTLRRCIQHLNTYSKYPTYYYKFMLKSNLNIKPKCLRHSDDVRYLFSNPTTKHLVTKGSLEDEYVNLMTTLWTNFAKTGDPNPVPTLSDDLTVIKWKPTKINNYNCLEIDHKLKLIQDPSGYRIKFLDNLFEFHAKI